MLEISFFRLSGNEMKKIAGFSSHNSNSGDKSLIFWQSRQMREYFFQLLAHFPVKRRPSLMCENLVWRMSWAKLKLLLWKNLTIQKRHPIGGLFEILFPICLSLFLAYNRTLTTLKTEPEYRFHDFEPLEFEKCA